MSRNKYILDANQYPQDDDIVMWTIDTKNQRFVPIDSKGRIKMRSTKADKYFRLRHIRLYPYGPNNITKSHVLFCDEQVGLKAIGFDRFGADIYLCALADPDDEAIGHITRYYFYTFKEDELILQDLYNMLDMCDRYYDGTKFRYMFMAKEGFETKAKEYIEKLSQYE